MIFLQGSPQLKNTAKVPSGRLLELRKLCAILSSKQSTSSYKTNCIEDWEQKIDAIIDETH